MQRFSRKALRNQASPQQKASFLHSVCTDFAPEKHRGVEQLVARQAHNLEVARSNPASATKRKIPANWWGFFFLELFQNPDAFLRTRMGGEHRIDEVHQPLLQLLRMDDIHLCNILAFSVT